MSWREMALAAAITIGSIAVFFFLNDPALLVRPFWYDELCCTMFAVMDASSPAELFGAVRRQDIAPPLLHLIVWTVTRIVGSTEPVVVRSISLVFTVAALLMVYRVLRFHFGRSASAAGVMIVACNGLVLQHATEARFYGPWLFFGVLLIWLLSLDAGRPSRRRDIAIGVVSVLICTIHWFGIISLALIAAGAVAAHGNRWREGVRLVAPAAAGVLALAALTPMMVYQLSAGGEAIRWVPPLKRDQLYTMGRFFVLRLPVAVAVLLILVGMLRGLPIAARLRELVRHPSLAAMLALIGIPLALIVVSVTLDPVMVPRYATLSALALAPVVALAVETTRRWARVGAVAFYAIVLISLSDRAAQYTSHSVAVADLYRLQFDTLRKANPHVPIVFPSGMRLYDVTGPQRAQGTAKVLLLTDSVAHELYPGDQLADYRWEVQREIKGVRNHHRVFGFPESITPMALDTTPLFLLFTTDQDLPPGWRSVPRFGAKLFPNHRSYRLSGIVAVYERVPRTKRVQTP